MTFANSLGWIAAGFTLVTFSMRSMIALRLGAISANVCFIFYGFMSDLYPVIVLHLLLFPCNLIRLYQLRPARRGVELVEGTRDRRKTDGACPTKLRIPYDKTTRMSCLFGIRHRDWLYLEGHTDRIRSRPGALDRASVRSDKGRSDRSVS